MTAAASEAATGAAGAAAAVLVPEVLTAAAFAPFGEVIEARGGDGGFPINDGWARRHHALATAVPGEGGSAILSIFRAAARPRPLRVQMLERHPLGSQAFVPMERFPWLVVVAARPEAAACRAFLARGDQGVQYAPGTWHHPLLVIQPQHDFLVVDRGGPGDNLEECRFPDAAAVEIAPV